MIKTILLFQMNYSMESYLNRLLADNRYEWDHMALHYIPFSSADDLDSYIAIAKFYDFDEEFLTRVKLYNTT